MSIGYSLQAALGAPHAARRATVPAAASALGLDPDGGAAAGDGHHPAVVAAAGPLAPASHTPLPVPTNSEVSTRLAYAALTRTA